MKPLLSDESRLFQVAWLYHEEELSKREIAKKLDVSPTHVGRLLKEANRRGFVRIEYSPPSFEDTALELQRCLPFLRRVIVTQDFVREHEFRDSISPADSIELFERYQTQMKIFGMAGANLLDELIAVCLKLDNCKPVRVALSGGVTVNEIVTCIPTTDRPDVRFLPVALLGRSPVVAEHIDPMVSVVTAWLKSGRHPKGVSLSTLTPFDDQLGTIYEYRYHLKRMRNSQAVKLWMSDLHQVSIAILGLGAIRLPSQWARVQDSEFVRTADGHLTIRGLLRFHGFTDSELTEKHAIGDLSYNVFDVKGETLDEFTVFVGEDSAFYRKKAMSRSTFVMAAAGALKFEALVVALKAKLINTLVTDVTTGERLIAFFGAARGNKA